MGLLIGNIMLAFDLDVKFDLSKEKDYTRLFPLRMLSVSSKIGDNDSLVPLFVDSRGCVSSKIIRTAVDTNWFSFSSLSVPWLTDGIGNLESTGYIFRYWPLLVDVSMRYASECWRRN
ncbi:hypothetical protein Tco_0282917 [Tanacetum coccineum]